MNNKLRGMTTLSLFFSLFSLFIIASDSPRPPREVTSWVGQLHHQWKKHEDPFTYATDGGHLEILTYLIQASDSQYFHRDANFLAQLKRSEGRSQVAGAQILENIHARNYDKLRKLLDKNRNGLTQYLINAVNILTTNTESTSSDTAIPATPTSDDGILGQTLGFLAKQWVPGEYVFKASATELASYLIAASQGNHCRDGHFHTHATRALKRMKYVHEYLLARIDEHNVSNAQEALDHNKAFLPVAHIEIFQKAINELKKQEEMLLSEEEEEKEEVAPEELSGNTDSKNLP